MPNKYSPLSPLLSCNFARAASSYCNASYSALIKAAMPLATPSASGLLAGMDLGNADMLSGKATPQANAAAGSIS